MNRKEKTLTWVDILCFLLLPLCGIGTGVARGETIQIPPPGDGASGVFFREKFVCARWVQSQAPDSKCLECHGSILKEEEIPVGGSSGSSPGVLMIHAQHMRSGKVNFTCLTCHKGVDPYQTSAAGLRNQVPANMCFKCHFPHGQE